MGDFGRVKATQEIRLQASQFTAEQLSADANLTEGKHHAAPIRWPPETELRTETREEEDLVQLTLDIRAAGPGENFEIHNLPL
jgi:hypothetical protein